MAQLAVESLWHFAGYLHLQDLLNLAPVRYEGAPTYTNEGYVPDHVSIGKEFDVDWPSPGQSLRISINLPDIDIRPPPFPNHIDPAGIIGFRPVNFILADGPSFYVDAPPNISAPGFSAPLPAQSLTVTANYTIGSSQYLDLLVQQSNMMFDLDVVFGNHDILETAEGVLDPQTLESLARLIGTTESFIPDAVRDALEHPGDIERESTSSDHDEYAPSLDQAGNQGTVIEIDGSGQFLNGEKIDAPEQAIAEQLADINAAIENVQVAPDDDTEPTDFAEVLNYVTSDGTNQIAKLGDNASVNAATLFDYEEALSSRIILGDYHETNAIVQINVLSDIDQIDVSGAALVEQLASTDNTLTNEATIVNDPGQLFGDATRGVPGSTDWQIDYIVGNFYDVSTVVQRNALLDDDVSYEDATHGQYTAELGNDGQLNITQLLELGSGYDLIIIAGDYYKFNSIIQTNIVLDDDLIAQYAEGGTQVVDADGNLLSNDAAIFNIGGATFKDVSDEAQLLADTIGAQTEEFDYALAIGLPGDGDDVFEVLYVTGDYYNYNIILQTNVITDVDQSEQSLANGGQDGGSDSQTAQTGGNAALNAAVIVDLDSQSDYQFLGGEVYEETLLVQANIIEDDEQPEDGTAGSDLDQDVVATIAALSGQDDTDQGGNQNTFTPPDANTSDSDIIGGILT